MKEETNVGGVRRPLPGHEGKSLARCSEPRPTDLSRGGRGRGYTHLELRNERKNNNLLLEESNALEKGNGAPGTKQILFGCRRNLV